MLKLAFTVGLLVFIPRAWGQADACEQLAKLSIASARVVLSQTVAAGSFRGASDAQAAEGPAFADLPAFCRVVLEITPAAGSAIKAEVWLPASGWNGKFRGQGNGGFAGAIDYRGLAQIVRQGYAGAATNTGHTAPNTNAQWALGHPELVTDYGYRAVHEMTLKGKAILQDYYRTPAKYSYFESCSNGGREALMEAQRFPADYDGILAGAPAADLTGLLTNAVHNTQALTLNPASYIPAAKLPAISSAVLAACDSKDGIADGILNDPRQCKFDPATLLCKGAENDDCLTPPQVATLRALYSGAHDSKGKLVFPGYPPGGELGSGGWAPWITGSAPGKSLMAVFGTQYFANMVYGDPQWNYATFSVDEGLAAGLQRTGSALDATDPDLGHFANRGGKLILYHGWNDPAISALSTVGYYDEVRKTMGDARTDSFLRLFMVPGMQHCAGGPGPDRFGQSGSPSASGPDDPQHDILLALERWVEKGPAPETVIAAKYPEKGSSPTPVMTRPLCAYPKIAKYKGSGDVNSAGSFVCASEK